MKKLLLVLVLGLTAVGCQKEKSQCYPLWTEGDRLVVEREMYVSEYSSTVGHTYQEEQEFESFKDSMDVLIENNKIELQNNGCE